MQTRHVVHVVATSGALPVGGNGRLYQRSNDGTHTNPRGGIKLSQGIN